MQRLEQLDVGDRTSLKRNIGKPITKANGAALAAFYKALPKDVGTWAENRYFTVACLTCLWKMDDVPKSMTPFEICLKKIRSNGYESFDIRVRAIIDSEWDDEDGYTAGKLARATKQMRQRNLVPDFAVLLEDLLFWNQNNRTVQRKWAKSYFGIDFDNDHKNTIMEV
ncbi:MAG: type I-E CRISPR-associated protein Cse2/CasB [Bacillota bacterium]|nr:type I-E CRISPR-associated protein Cse2/CasB [Bacillota bacterium]